MARSTDLDDFGRRPHRLLARRKRSVRAVVAHLDGLSGQFDSLTRTSDPNRITAVDLVAVSMIGPSVPPRAAAWILGADGQWLTTEILADIPRQSRVWDCEPGDIVRAADLFHLLRASTSQIGGKRGRRAMGQASATRLLAAKRPDLVPIDDGAIRGALRYPKDGYWWRRWRRAIDAELLELADQVRADAAKERPAAADLPTLRLLDIAVRRARAS